MPLLIDFGAETVIVAEAMEFTRPTEFGEMVQVLPGGAPVQPRFTIPANAYLYRECCGMP